ncbi:sugar ABC transporter substrate-binding protein [Cohnella hongkongensis]|uniref:Sugar ABC transporter substrate-binding protein n=1 Tax=Cohnella hongkongensis TaxID=178337 RepID=A0ABV9F9N0_9BACL
MATTTERLNRKLPLLLTLLLFAAIAAIGGCRGETLPAEPGASARPSSPSAAKQTHTFGIIYPMMHSFYETITRSAEEAAAKIGVRLVVKAPGEANLEQQIRMMETLIVQRVDGIAIAPIDADALAPLIDKAVDSGIPVICFESDSPDSKRLAYVGGSNPDAGRKMGEQLNERLKGKGMILVETGMPRMRSLNERLEGLLAYLNERTDIQVLEVRYHEGNEARALQDLEEMLDAHPHFDAFVGLDAVSGSASILVWKAKGLSRYALTIGLSPQHREGLRNGQLTAVLSQQEEEWGRRIVETLEAAAQGRAIPSFGDAEIEVFQS